MMNIRSRSYDVRTHATHATFRPLNKVDVLMSPRKPEAGFVGDQHYDIRAHDVHNDLAIGRGFAVQFKVKRITTGEIVRSACRKL